MDMEEIRYLLGSTIYARAKAYENRVQDLECETAENGVRHLSADVRAYPVTEKARLELQEAILEKYYEADAD